MKAPLRYADWARRFDGKAAGAYLLAGPESLLRDAALARIREAVLGTGDGARLGQDRFYGGECSLAEVARSLASVGLFTSERLITLHDPERCGRAGAADRKELLDRLCGGTPGSTFVALTGLNPGELERKNEFTRALLSACQVVVVDHPRPADALRWLMTEAGRRRIALLADAGRLLLARIGPNLQELSRELDKLEAAVGPGEEVTAATLAALVHRGELGSGWELCRAASEGRTADALRQWGAIQATEAVLRLQWLLQKTARDGLAAGPGSSQLRSLLLASYDLEFGIKSGLIPGRQDAVALEMLLVASGMAGSRAGAVRPDR